MNNNKTTGIENYTGLFQQIIHLLGKTPEEIINSYPDHEMSLLEWPKSYGMKERLEIRFQEEQATLTCEFDKKKDIQGCKYIHRHQSNGRRMYPCV